MEDKKVMHLLLLLLFFTHGILYFIYPVELNNPSSFIKFIKYIIIVFFSIYFLNTIKLKELRNIIFILTISFVFYLVANNFVLEQIYFLFLIPIVITYLYINEIDKHILYKASKYIYFIISLFAYIEYTFFSAFFTKFSYGIYGYRCSSILVNPNNFGITIVFITIYLLENLKYKILKGIVLLNSIILIYFSFSKTAMVILLIYLMYKNYKFFIPIFSLLTFLLVLNNKINIDDKYTASLDARVTYNSNMYDMINNNIFFPFLNSYQYTDNIYLHIWGSFGLLGLLTYIFLIVFTVLSFLLSKMFINVLILILFLFVGYTTNYLYLWPLAYMFWGFVFYNLNIIYKVKKI